MVHMELPQAEQHGNKFANFQRLRFYYYFFLLQVIGDVESSGGLM